MDDRPLLRRLRTVPTFVAALLVMAVLAPVALPFLAVFDAGRHLLRKRPWMGTRLYLFGLIYFGAEVAGLAALGAVWPAAGFGKNRARLMNSTFGIQQAWASALLWAARRIFRLRFEVAGTEAIPPGPFLLMVRHASIVDNLLPAAYVSRPTGIRLRYVLKRELLGDPCLDVAGNRLPNYFVRRGSGETDRELAEIRRLGENLASHEAVLIYPEGTRFTPEKQRATLTRMERADPALRDRARRLRHVLPPRLSGPLALLDATDPADVVVMAHHGLDGFAHLQDIWAGGMVDTTIRVQFWRFPRAGIPTERSARVDWLYDVWTRVDEWIDQIGSGA